MSTGNVRLDGRTQQQYLQDLEQTMADIAAVVPPGDDALAAAPLIFSWMVDDFEDFAGRRFRRIVGFFDGHPYLPSGSYGHTSPLLQLDREMKWARCLSRLYRLSKPLSKLKLGTLADN